MAKRRDASKETDKQISRVSQNIQEYRDGVNDLTESPGKLAVKKKDKFRANLMAAIDSGKWEENTAATDLDDWKRRTAGTGADRLVQGMEDSREKTIAFRQQLIDFQNNLKAKLDAMPDTTPEQREAKAIMNIREMRKFRRSGRRR